MVNTRSKEIQDKVQAHIKNMMKGNGGVTALYKDIDREMSLRGDRRIYRTPYDALYDWTIGGNFLIPTVDVVAELHRWGIKDDRRIYYYKDSRTSGPLAFYAHLIGLYGSKMYDQYKKNQNSPKKTVRKTTTKKTVRRTKTGV